MRQGVVFLQVLAPVLGERLGLGRGPAQRSVDPDAEAQATAPLDDAAADPRWPASPVLTEVSLVGAAGRPAIVGLGLAGRSHFSVSVAAHPDRPDTLLFEVACRIQEPPGWLGSTYRAADGGSVQAAPQAVGTDLPRTVQWSYAVGPGGVVPLPTAAGPRRP